MYHKSSIALEKKTVEGIGLEMFTPIGTQVDENKKQEGRGP